MLTTRTVFLVDGLNLYHSLQRASHDLGGQGTRWLDLRALCDSYLSLVGGNAHLERVICFTALAKHLEILKPDVTRRHQDYLQCLRATGVSVELAQFKRKVFTCPHCSKRITRHEEKETDVAIATALLELLAEDRCDAVVLVTGDSDLTPAVRIARRLFPNKQVCCCFPFARVSSGLRAIATQHFTIRSEHYVRHQLADPFVLPDGKAIPKPVGW